jgi:uncharacterized protein YjeT (DUF2065 family)
MSFWVLLAVGFGFCLIIEGLAYALFPRQFLAMWEMVRTTPPETIRVAGIGALAVGVGIVWIVL